MVEAHGLNVCASEPIHIPGLIQDFGCLVVLGPDGTIRHVSGNAERFFATTPENLLGRPFAQAIAPELCAELMSVLKAAAAGRTESLHRVRYLPEPALLANVSVHRRGDACVVEFEHCLTHNKAQSERQYQTQQQAMQARLYQTLGKLHDATSLEGLCQEAVDAIAEITGYDRVIVYRFDAQWRGSVLAERKTAAMPSYLGQSFPASDIPPQAREVFRHNASRMICDVAAPEVPLLPTLNPATGAPFDMGRTQLRAPSPVHLEYLRNMGVAGTLTLTLLVEGKLWGLVACHHSTAKVTDVAHREAAEIVAKAFSVLIVPRLYADGAATRLAVDVRLQGLIERLKASPNDLQALMEGEVTLANLCAPAVQAAAVLMDGRWLRSPGAPSVTACAGIVERLRESTCLDEIFHTDHAARAFPDVALDSASCCGVVAIRLAQKGDAYVLWFAPEVVQAIDWAGRPEKVTSAHDPSRIHPRQSFARYREEVRDHSMPWTDIHLDAAKQLRRAIIEWDLNRQVTREREARAEVEAEKQRFSLLAAASAFFGKPLGDGAALQGLAKFLTQQFCDWLVITGTDDEHTAHEASAHRDSDKALALATATADGTMVQELAACLTAAGDPLAVPVNLADKHGIVAHLGLASCVALPLTVHTRALGAIYFVRTAASPPFDENDMRLATQLAERVAGVLDNDRSYRQSQSAIRSREYVLRIVSHDLRNPLGLVSLSAQSLRRRLREVDPAVWQEPIKRIGRACSTMERLIGDVLSAANIESGSFQVRPEWLQGTEFLADVTQALEPLCHAAKLQLVVGAKGVADTLYGDRDRLLQAMGNLVSNAIRFTPPGGSIAIDAVRQGHEVVLTVADTGQGIPKDRLPKIFDQFWQGDQSAQSGAGLGLFIVRGIVSAHQGTIHVQSAVGEGTTFQFNCPDAG